MSVSSADFEGPWGVSLLPPLFDLCWSVAEGQVAWSKEHHVDYSVGEEKTHRDRQFSGACGEAAAALFLGLDAEAELEKKRLRRKPDHGITYELPGVGTFEVRTTRAESPEGLMRGRKAKLAADWWIACRHGYSTRPGRALILVRGYARREDWPALEEAVEFGSGDRRQEVFCIPIGKLRDFGVLLAGVARARKET